MSRLRTSMALLGICVAALLVGGLRLLTERATLPIGSSYSAQPDGARGLYEWTAALGGNPSRIQSFELGQDNAGLATTTLVMVQPEGLIGDAASGAFDAVLEQGGTLVAAGDSLAWVLYARQLGITVEPLDTPGTSSRTVDGELLVPAAFHYRLRASGATPLLVLPSGDWVALRIPHRKGTLVVLGSPTPLTNAGLRSDETVRFVYRDVLSGATPSSAYVFDEADHSFAPVSADRPATFEQLLVSSAAGRAALYAAVLAFSFVVLSGRRLGPALAARSPMETRRTMYEYVQMLAGLYRRAGQLPEVRASFARQLARELAHGAGSSPRRAVALGQALAQIELARTESELVSAVAAAQPEP